MKFEATVRTDDLLREMHEPRLFELFHENSKLSLQTAAGLMAAQDAVTDSERYLTTRGFRQYRTETRVALLPTAASDQPLQDIIRRRRSVRNMSGAVELNELSTLLDQALGCTAIVEQADSGIAHALRAWPSAGGLYPLDTYLIASKVGDLAQGLYHYNVIAGELEHLPSRPPEKMIAEAFFDQAFANSAAVLLLFVACFDRTVAKYGERGYRLVLLDAGHAAQNVLLTAEQMHLNAVALGGYCDDVLAADLGIDGVSEAVVHTVLLGRPQ